MSKHLFSLPSFFFFPQLETEEEVGRQKCVSVSLSSEESPAVPTVLLTRKQSTIVLTYSCAYTHTHLDYCTCEDTLSTRFIHESNFNSPAVERPTLSKSREQCGDCL